MKTLSAQLSRMIQSLQTSSVHAPQGHGVLGLGQRLRSDAPDVQSTRSVKIRWYLCRIVDDAVLGENFVLCGRRNSHNFH
eukprot:7590181-Pyramimonas_sp.AAC.1